MQNSALSVNKVKVEVEVQGFSLPLFEFLSVWNVRFAYFTESLFLMISCFRHFLYKSSVLRSNGLFPLNEHCLTLVILSLYRASS